jgi:serine/threonine protein kinase
MRLGRYELLLPVAQGGMARVWAARQHGQRGFTKLVAIKTILPQLAADPNFEAMFLDEARLAAGVHHPNVCEIFDLGEEQDCLYIAMEWVNGDSVSRLLKPYARKGEKPVAYRLNARVAARIVADAAKGLHAAHELRDETGQPLNVVHRDVSPQNILVTADGVIKMTDFGVAKALGTQHEVTMAGQVKGKVAYMSPEQARGGRIDRRSDVFALGIVLYEVTTGRRPFAGDNELDVMRALAQGQFDPPSVVVPGFPHELEAIILNAMSMDPEQRFPTAEAMRGALDQWLARSGPLVSEADVAATLRERLGSQNEEKMARIRERLAAPAELTDPGLLVEQPPGEGSRSQLSAASVVSAPSHVSAPSTASHASAPSAVSTVSHATAPSAVSAAWPMVQTTAPASQAGPTRGGATAKTALLGVVIGIGVFAVVAVGGGGYYLLRSRARAAAAQPATSTPEPALSTSAAGPAAVAEIPVTLVEPESGVTLLVDGIVQPVGKLSVPRPQPGATRKLTARALGYRDLELKFDASTKDLELKLKKDEGDEAETDEPEKTAEKPGNAPPPANTGNATSVAPAAKPTSAPKPKPVKPDIPDNPF